MSSDSIGTGIGTGANTGAAVADNGNAGTAKSPLLFADDLILFEGILPFVGVGQYAFIGPVNKKMNQLYKDYCERELQKNPRKVKDDPQVLEIDSRSAEITDTLYSETFCNVPRAEYWLRDNSSNKKPRGDLVCTAIAKIGNIMVMPCH